MLKNGSKKDSNRRASVFFSVVAKFFSFSFSLPARWESLRPVLAHFSFQSFRGLYLDPVSEQKQIHDGRFLECSSTALPRILVDGPE